MIGSGEQPFRPFTSFKDRTTIDHLPQLRILAQSDGGLLSFSWPNKYGKSVNLQIVSVAYKGNTGLQEGNRLAVIVMKQNDSREPVSLVDCEVSSSQKIAAISLPEDSIFNHNELLNQYGITRSKKIAAPFEVLDEFRKTDLSQITLAVTQAILEQGGIEKIHVWEDRTLDATREYPYVRSAYFKYSKPITKFNPPGKSMMVGWLEQGSAHVYSIPTKPTKQQVSLLIKAFSNEQFSKRRSMDEIQMNRNVFKKLSRHIRVLERQGKPIDEAKMLKLRSLDAWLCQNDKTWHTNFPTEPK